MSVSRREFVSGLGALGTVWLAAAAACRREAEPEAQTHAPIPDPPQPPQQLVHFTPAEGVEIEAMTARIIPSDETPGAREAGVVYFVDKALTTFAADQKQLYADGLVQLQKDVAKKHKGETKFSALTAEQQDDILRGIEKSDFFGSLRFATVAGMFALPKYGGNKDFIGWRMVGREPVFEFAPPFGWYDRPENQQALLGKVL